MNAQRARQRNRARSRRGPARRGPNPLVIGGAIATVLAAIALGLFVASSEDPGTDLAVEHGTVSATGTGLAPLPESGPDPAAGQAAPALRATNPSGETVEVAPGDGEPLMLVFLAHWCPHCQRELPRLVQLEEEGALSGVRSVAVLTSTTTDRPNYPPSAWLESEAWAADQLYDDEAGTAAAAYGLSGFPFLVFVDADGQVVRRLSGEQDPALVAGIARQLARDAT